MSEEGTNLYWEDLRCSVVSVCDSPPCVVVRTVRQEDRITTVALDCGCGLHNFREALARDMPIDLSALWAFDSHGNILSASRGQFRNHTRETTLTALVEWGAKAFADWAGCEDVVTALDRDGEGET